MTHFPSHIPVLLDPILAASQPVQGVWVDGTFGAGGYTRALLDAGAEQVIAIDRDPHAHDLAESWAGIYGSRLKRILANFADMAEHVPATDGVVLDLGVSSMQLDEPERGFSFLRDGPLDMRMGDAKTSAADIVNTASAEMLSNILFQYGEERAARRIAAAIIENRPFYTTHTLAACIETVLPKSHASTAHPATRSFQALRIAVNDELGSLIAGLEAAEKILRPNGILGVVSFHSLEDRIVKKFIHARVNRQRKNRYATPQDDSGATFSLIERKAIKPSKTECKFNPRARSAKLRLAKRNHIPAVSLSREKLGLPRLAKENLCA